nr:hypothetical protein CFP56_74997 [Quercus suber]
MCLHKWEEWIGVEGQEEEDCIVIMPRLQKLLNSPQTLSKISYIPNIRINYIEVQRDGQEVNRQAMMKKSFTKNSMSDDEEEGE